jgi:ribokinase
VSATGSTPGPAAQPDRYDVVVVGSVNVDHTVRLARAPGPGETVIAAAHQVAPGGKGANQAASAVAAGAHTLLVTRLGSDPAAGLVEPWLRRAGVLLRAESDPTASTGLAMVMVLPGGENTIVVAPGANAGLRPGHLPTAAVRDAAVVLAQLEIPVETVGAAARTAGGTVILNPAPADGPLPDELLGLVDVLVPNRTELAALTGARVPASVDQAADLAAGLADRGPTVVVTLGADGAVVCDGRRAFHVAAPRVEVVDTSGAGDAFCGALAAALACGADMPEAVRRGVAAGALAVARRGAMGIGVDSEALEQALRDVPRAAPLRHPRGLTAWPTPGSPGEDT